jgi:hypothetical protein
VLAEYAEFGDVTTDEVAAANTTLRLHHDIADMIAADEVFGMP